VKEVELVGELHSESVDEIISEFRFSDFSFCLVKEVELVGELHSESVDEIISEYDFLTFDFAS
jgi:hypothetical protein